MLFSHACNVNVDWTSFTDQQMLRNHSEGTVQYFSCKSSGVDCWRGTRFRQQCLILGSAAQEAAPRSHVAVRSATVTAYEVPGLLISESPYEVTEKISFSFIIRTLNSFFGKYRIRIDSFFNRKILISYLKNIENSICILRKRGGRAPERWSFGDYQRNHQT